jgi:DNA-binding transcriptional LysR family regulator
VIDLVSLAALRAVDAHGSVVAAADALGFTPSAVSQQIKRLEKQTEGTICRQWLNRMYDGTGARPRIAHVSMEFETHIALARAGLGPRAAPRLDERFSRPGRPAGRAGRAG